MWIPLRFQTNHSKLQSVWFLEFPSTVQADLLGEPGVSTYQKKIAGAYQPGSVPPTPGAAKEGTGGKKMGISAAAGKVNQICVFIGSDLDGPIGSDLDGKAFQTASCWDPTGVTQEIRLPCPRVREMGRRSRKWRSRCSAGACTAWKGSA